MENYNEIRYWILKFISWNSIGSEGAEKIGEGVSKLLYLTSLNLNLR
jgi:hypothetical protein